MSADLVVWSRRGKTVKPFHFTDQHGLSTWWNERLGANLWWLYPVSKACFHRSCHELPQRAHEQGCLAEAGCRSHYKVPHVVEVSYEVLQIAQISHGLICASNQWDLVHGTVALVIQRNRFTSPRGWIFLYYPSAKFFLLKAVIGVTL